MTKQQRKKLREIVDEEFYERMVIEAEYNEPLHNKVYDIVHYFVFK